ncbi:hypothetical protein BH24ACT5_BH24ACT5_26500 [soil metagenome]
MVLRHRSVDLPAGVVAVNGFAVEMSRVFEDFLTVVLTDALERIDGRVQAQDRHGLDAERTVEMKPDLVWYRRGAPVAVVDAKYKIEHHGAPNADLYQMLAYCTALGLPEGHLVYAKGNDQPAGVIVRNAGITLHVHALDLDVPPAALLDQISDLAEVLRPPPR